MEREVSFLSLFPDYEPEDEQRALLSALRLRDAQLDRAARTITLELDSEVYITEELLDTARAAIEQRYGLRALELQVHYPESALETLPPRALYRAFTQAYSPAAASLAGLFGLTLGAICLVVHLAGLDSFGISYLAPFSGVGGARALLRPRLVREPLRDPLLRPLDRRNQGGKR